MFGKLRTWSAIATVALITAPALASGCGDDGAGGTGDAGNALNTIKRGELRVGSDIPYPPFEFGRGPDYQGFDVDLVNEIAKRLDLEARFVRSPFNLIFRNLAQGRFDMVASAAPITAEHEQTVDFSDPYFPVDQSVTVKRGSRIRTLDDLAGKTIGVQRGTAGARYARNEVDARTVRPYDLIDDAFKALQTGQLEAVIYDFAVSKYQSRLKKNLVVVHTIEGNEDYGLAFEQGSKRLRERVNATLARMKRDGTYARIYRKWFEQDPPKR